MMKRHLVIVVLGTLLLSNLNGTWIGPVMASPQARRQSVDAPALRSGDVVRLRSGGPLMTVHKVEGGLVTCYWSTDDGDVRFGSFSIADLTAPITLPLAGPG
jgi:uncharacterized protein YodC (DUF2158 family)